MFRLSTLALLLSCTAAAADTLAPVLVEAEVATDSAEPQVGDVVLEEYTGSHHRIEREQLQRPGGSLGESLAFEAGVQHSQAGAEGSYSAITLRGASASQTPVYWDGVRLNGAAQPSIDLSDLELLNLDSVDIYRGSAPLQLGGGIGGAIALNSPRTQGQSTVLRAQLGSFSSRGLQLGYSLGGRTWQSNTLFSRRTAKNNFSLINDNGTEFNANDDRKERRNNAGFERNALLSKLSLNPHENEQYDLSLQHTAKDLGVPEWRNRADNEATFDTQTTLLQFNQRLTGVRDSDWNTRLGLHGQKRREVYDDRLSQVGIGAQHSRSRSDSTGATAYAERIDDQGTLALQAEIRNEKLRSDDWVDAVSASAKRREHNLSAHYAWFNQSEQWLLTAGAQWQDLKDSYNGLYRDGKDRRTGDHQGFSLGAQYNPSETWRWQFNLGEFYREPSFYELFGDRGLHVGNDELTAESGINADISVLWLHTRGELQLAAFQSDRDNLIATVFSAQGIGHSENIGGAQVRGLELNATQKLAPQWKLRLTATAQDAKNQSRINAFYGKQLPGQAQLQGALRLSHERQRSHWWIEGSALDGKYYDTANLLFAEDQLVFNAGATLKRQHWQFSLTVNNLSDERVEDFNGFAKPGRNAHISASYHFRRSPTH